MFALRCKRDECRAEIWAQFWTIYSHGEKSSWNQIVLQNVESKIILAGWAIDNWPSMRISGIFLCLHFITFCNLQLPPSLIPIYCVSMEERHKNYIARDSESRKLNSFWCMSPLVRKRNNFSSHYLRLNPHYSASNLICSEWIWFSLWLRVNWRPYAYTSPQLSLTIHWWELMSSQRFTLFCEFSPPWARALYLKLINRATWKDEEKTKSWVEKLISNIVPKASNVRCDEVRRNGNGAKARNPWKN